MLGWKLNRFARSRSDSITYKMLLQKKGIWVISSNEPIPDFGTPAPDQLNRIIQFINKSISAQRLVG
ncbi:hypothetical protein ACFLYS_00320 [Chloroflexota bacterium]